MKKTRAPEQQYLCTLYSGGIYFNIAYSNDDMMMTHVGRKAQSQRDEPDG